MQQIAKHLRDVHFGGNWTCVNLRDTLQDVSLSEALHKREGFNTIAVLANHIHYYVHEVAKALKTGALTAKDEYSFTHPDFQTEADWENFKNKMWEDANEFATGIESLPEENLTQPFIEDKYGNYFRNLHGIIEHTHYHLGQIVILKKLMRTG